jgi:hypothetical protein
MNTIHDVEIISCDISSGRTYFTGKLYHINSTDVKFVPVNYLVNDQFQSCEKRLE